MGIEFVMDDAAYPEIVKFVYGDSQRWADILEQRLKPVHSFRATSRDLHFFLQRGVRGIIERIVFLAHSAATATITSLQGFFSKLPAHIIRWKRSVAQL
jgi:hypothetical protein